MSQLAVKDLLCRTLPFSSEKGKLNLMKYTILEIAGKQIKAEPGKPFDITLQEDSPEAKVLMNVDGEKISIGKPYLKDTVKLRVLEQKKGKKIRVAKFHAKANYRKVRGFRPQISKVVMEVEG